MILTSDQLEKLKQYVREIKEAKFKFNRRTEAHLKDDLYRYLLFILREKEVMEKQHNSRRFA